MKRGISGHRLAAKGETPTYITHIQESKKAFKEKGQQLHDPHGPVATNNPPGSIPRCSKLSLVMVVSLVCWVV